MRRTRAILRLCTFARSGAMSLQPRHRIDFDDWLAAERAAPEVRSEYADGEIFAMSGGSERHNLIVTNVVGELRSQFEGRPGYVYASDMKVRIASAKVGAYPDVMATCGERQFYDERRDMVANPTLIVEVLSDSTEAYDRGGSFAHYRSLPSLESYLPISQNRVGAELYVRQPNDSWTLTVYTALSDEIPLAVVDAVLPLAEIYDKVELPVNTAGIGR